MRRRAFNLFSFCGPIAGMALAGPALADDIVPPKVIVSMPAGVNIVDGYFQHNVTDLSIGTLKLERFTLPPAKLAVNDPYFGPGVTHNFDIYVGLTFIKAIPAPFSRPAEYHTIAHIGQGASGVYWQSGALSPTINEFNLEADKGILTQVSSGGAYIYTDDTGAVYTFNPSVHAGGASSVYSQRVSNIVYPDGRKENYAYNGSGQLKMVSDTAGYAIIFDYNGNGDVSTACGFNLAVNYVTATSTCAGAAYKVSYAYTSSLLTSVADALNNVTTYTRYGTSYGSPISCVTPPGYAACKVTNQGFDTYRRINQQVTIDGAIWSLDFEPTTCNPDPDNPEGGGTCIVGMIDPDNKTSWFDFAHSSPTSVQDANGHVTTYHWMGSNLQWPSYDQSSFGPYLVEADLPEGNKFLGEYMAPFNKLSKATMVAKPGSGLADQVQIWSYGPCTAPGTLQNCGKPISITDPKGNVTNFTYASHGGVLSEMKPAPTAGAARPLKLTTWVQKYAYIKNAGGTLVPAATPIWMMASETQCQTVAGSNSPVCDAAAPQRVTTYEYGADGAANNLNVRGVVVTADGSSRRSCYLYDNSGNRISETRPRAGLGVCP